MNLNLRCPEARSLFGEQRRRGERASAWGWRGGTPTAESWRTSSPWGKGPSAGHPFQFPLLCKRREVDGATYEPQPPNRPTPAVYLGSRQSVGRRASAPGSAGPRERGRGAQRGGRRAGGGLAARPHVAGPRGGVGGAEGEGLHPAKFPDGLSLPALSAFPARPAQPYGPGRSFPEKNARRAAGPWSRTEPLLGKGRAAAAAESAIGLRGLGAAPLETLAAAGTPGRGRTGRRGRAARRGAGWARAGAGERRGCVRCGRGRGRAVSGGARLGPSGSRVLRVPAGGGRRGRGPVGSGRGRFQGWARCWARSSLGPPRGLAPRSRRRYPLQGLRGMRWGATPPTASQPQLRRMGAFGHPRGQFLLRSRLAFFARELCPSRNPASPTLLPPGAPDCC